MANGFPPFQGPADAVMAHALLGFSDNEYSDLVKLLRHGSFGSLRPGRVLHFGAGLRTDAGFNFIDFDLNLQGRKKAGQRTIMVSIGQHQHSGNPPKALVDSLIPGQIEAMIQVLEFLEQKTPAGPFTCHVTWDYQMSEVKPIVPLPFPLPVVTKNELNLINGIRLTNYAETISVIIDKGEEKNRLIVSARFPATLGFSNNMLLEVLEKGDALIKDLVRNGGAPNDSR